MKQKNALLIRIFACICSVLLLTACSSNTTNNADKETPKEKVLLVGTQNDYPPFAFADENNQLTGFDVDVLKEVGERLDGYTIKFVATPWDSMFLSLESNKIQAIADQVAVTEQRQEKYLFSDESYFSAETVIVTDKENDDVESLKDLEGKKVGALAGDSYTLILEEYNETAENKINLVYSESGNPSEILQDIQTGRLDAYVNDPIMIHQVIDKFDLDLKIVGQPIVNDAIGVVFKKDEDGKNLKALIDPILKEMKVDGTLAKLSEKWTGGVYIPN